MDLSRLRQFVAIAQLGSMREAARAVHITQPALSRSIQELEHELDVKLFSRGSRRLVLTAAGRAFLPRAQALLELAERAVQETRRSAERGYVDWRVGCVDSVACSLLPTALETLDASFPGLSVEVSTGRTSSLLDLVRRGRLDAAVVAHSGPPPDVPSMRIARYELRFFGRSDRFAELRRLTQVSELAKFPRIEIQPVGGRSPDSEKAPRPRAVVSNVATVKAMVMGGFGVGDLPSFVLHASERKGLVAANIPHDKECALFLATGPTWTGDIADAISSALTMALRKTLRPSRSARSDALA